MDKRKVPDRSVSSLLVHNQSRTDRTDPRANSFKFRKIKFESPDVSVLSDFSEQHDLVSRSNFETPSQTPKLKFSLEECSYSLERDYDGIRGLEKGESRRLNISDLKKLPIASIGELQEEEPAKVVVPSLTDSPVMKPQKPSFKKAVTQFFSGQSHVTKNLVEDTIHKKQTLTDKSARFKSNRLLGIIATHAASQKNTDVTKVLKAALIKVNPEALEKAQIDATRKKRKIRKIFRSYAGWKNVIVGPWKPESRFIVYWKVILLFAIMVQAFISTYIIAFLDDTQDFGLSNKFVVIDFVVDIAYIFSILIRLRTAYYHQGELRIKSSDIIFNYLKGSFVADILSELSLIGRFAPNANSQYLILMTLFKIFQIKGLITSIEDHFQFSRLSRTVVEVLKLCCAMMLLAHWFACMLYYITRNEPHDESWLVTANLQRSQTDDIYVAALYWAVATMSTVGYGDITPRTTKERVLVIAIMIFSSIVFGYLLSSIGSLLFELTTFSSESREKIRLVNKYMKEKGLSKDIQSKIRKYLQFYLDKENSVHTEADNILQMLSQTLKDEIIKEVNARVLDDAKIFSSNFRSKFLNIVSREFTEKSFGPDDFIFHHNDVTNLSAYFITAGRVEILYEKSGVSLQKINKGDNFGLFSFFSGNPRTAGAKSVEFTNCFVLSREKFFEKLEEYPSEKEMYMMIKESITLQGSYQYFNISCYSCNSKEHIALECPKVHFITNRKKTISNYLINQRFFRRQYQRRDRQKFKVLSNLEAIHEAAIQHQLSQQNELYFDDNEDEDIVEVRSYSSIDEILDKNVYDLQPLIYNADATQFRAYAVHEDASTSGNSLGNPSSPSLSHITKKKQRKKQKMAINKDRLNPEGEIENFVRLNFDKYYHNLNLDRVKNYEVYNPVNNVNRLVLDLDRSRIMRGVEDRLSGKSKHISKWLIKGFRMNENKTPKTFQSTDALDKLGGGKKDITERRKSVMPGDIMMYSTKLQKQFGNKHGNDSSRSRIGFYDSDHTIRKLSNDTAKKPKKNKRPAKSKMAATAVLPGSQTNKDLVYKTKRQVSALTKSKQVDTDSSQNSDSSDSDSSSVTSSNVSETDEVVTPKLNIKLSLDPTPNNRNHEEKLLTANFGDVTTKNAFVGRSISPKTPSRTRLPLSPTSNQEIKDIRGRPIITSEQNIGRIEHDENDSKKPVAMFDFTRLLKKMTGKLEENSKSYRKTATTATAASHRPQHSFTNKTSTTQSRQSRQPTSKYREDLLVKLLHKKNKNVGSRKKGRASSVEDGKEVRKVMDMYGLEEILQGK